MGWSIRLFSVAGTAVRIHLTFFLLLAFYAAVGWNAGGAPGASSPIFCLSASSC